MAEPVWAAAVRRLRAGRGWSQGELADRAGVRGNTLSAALNGQTSPRLDTLEKLAAAFEVPIVMLFVDERQAELLNRQRTADSEVAREADIATRVEQRVLAKLTAAIREETAVELARPVAAPPPITRKTTRRRSA